MAAKRGKKSSNAHSRKRRKAGTPRWRRAGRAALRRPFLSAGALALAVFAGYVAILNWQITSRFEGRRWDLPAHVYARPLELHAGLDLSANDLEAEVSRLGYRAVAERPGEPGTFRRYRNRIELKTRPFRFWDGPQPGRYVDVTFGDGIARLTNGKDDIAIGRIEPLMIGSIFPQHGEDRLIVAPEDVPPLLPAALQAVEDRRFTEHFGIDPLALLRALAANVRAGGITQGGSTLTQQLVKNYFLDNRRTIRRKIQEAIMAVILEAHYDKPEILNAYINEVYMGQQGNRAIHGFGLASGFYFSRPLEELELHQIALLVAIVRGPGYYDPVRFPKRAAARRNLILDQLAAQNVISDEAARQAAGEDLDLWDAERLGASYYPGYLKLVRRQLSRDYRDADLTREGLRIFTALDPLVQASAERRLGDGLEVLDAARDATARRLAGAVIVTSASSGEVLAIVGDRQAGFAGFNRALDARRPIGSLVKPAIYLAALESGRYTLASTVDDTEVTVELANGDQWTPSNFHDESHGTVSLLRALAESMNMAAVNLGLEVGVDKVAAMLGTLGFDEPLQPYPSLMLGSVGMAPIEVAQVYGTLAGGGFRTPQRAVLSVIDASGEPLQRYPIEVEQVVGAETVYQLNQALVEVMRRGTGRTAGAVLPDGFAVAGKTGTSGGFRDSWFAGFTGEHVMVVWVGYDDNSPTGLTGASGALPIWAAILDDIGSAPLAPPVPAGLEARWIQYETGAEVARRCDNAVRLLLPRGAVLERGPGCGFDMRRLADGTVGWFRDIIN